MGAVNRLLVFVFPIEELRREWYTTEPTSLMPAHLRNCKYTSIHDCAGLT